MTLGGHPLGGGLRHVRDLVVRARRDSTSERRPLPALVRWVMLAVLTMNLVDDLARTVVGWPDGPVPMSWTREVGGLALGYVVMYLIAWRPVLGAYANLVQLVFSLVTGANALGPVLSSSLLFVLLPMTSGWPVTLTIWALQVAWLVPVSIVKNDWDGVFWTSSALYVIAAVIGVGVRLFQDQQDRDRERIRALERENARIREDERKALARELHDVVAHELSIISLQTISRHRTNNPDELNRILDTVDRSVHSALREMRLVIGLLRDEDGQQGSDARPDPEDIGRLSADTSIRTMAERITRELTALGYHATIRISGDVDDLPAAMSRTVIRILQEGATNVMRHAPAGCRCSTELTCTTDDVVVRLANSLAGGAPNPGRREGPAGWGLRGIRERVALLGGRMTAGRNGTDWVVEVSLPRSTDRRTPVAVRQPARATAYRTGTGGRFTPWKN